jgi:hypothetical protein
VSGERSLNSFADEATLMRRPGTRNSELGTRNSELKRVYRIHMPTFELKVGTLSGEKDVLVRVEAANQADALRRIEAVMGPLQRA